MIDRVTGPTAPKGRVNTRVMKALFADKSGSIIGESQSLQLPEDDFRSLYGTDLQEPPFSMEQLVFLAEQHPIHNAALAQKAADVIGKGWEWSSTKKEGDDDDEDQRDKLEEWFSGLIDPKKDETLHETLLNAADDLETTGWGLIEIARDPSGKVKYLYPMPAHTCRAARDGIRICQIRQGKRVWFKRWIPDDDRVVGMNNGQVYENRKATRAKIGNEVLVIKKPARRSTWYGIPTYVSSLGWITLSILARDDNILFFENRREPRWAIILTNIEDDPNLEDDLKEALQVDLKSPHRNLVIPIEGPGKIEFKQLSDLTKNDMSFEKLQERANAYVLTGHRIPSDRLGMTRVGPLGGSMAIDSTKVYKEGVIQTTQSVLNARLNRFIKHECDLSPLTWDWACEELDLTEDKENMDEAVSEFQVGIITLNEARRKIGEPELDANDPRGDMYITELAMYAQQQAGQNGGTATSDDPGQPMDDNSVRNLIGGDRQSPTDSDQQQEAEPDQQAAT